MRRIKSEDAAEHDGKNRLDRGVFWLDFSQESAPIAHPY